MRDALSSLDAFEYLNAEKITPYFVKLTKGNRSEATTDDICDDNVRPFISVGDRNNYVRQFYSNLYRNPEPADLVIEGCIEEFLCPEILETALVWDGKLDEETAQKG